MYCCILFLLFVMCLTCTSVTYLVTPVHQAADFEACFSDFKAFYQNVSGFPVKLLIENLGGVYCCTVAFN